MNLALGKDSPIKPWVFGFGFSLSLILVLDAICLHLALVTYRRMCARAWGDGEKNIAIGTTRHQERDNRYEGYCAWGSLGSRKGPALLTAL